MSKDRTKKTGYSSYCRLCSATKRRNRRNRDKEASRQKERAWYQRNALRLREQKKNWASANRDKVNSYKRKCRSRNLIAYQLRERLYRVTAKEQITKRMRDYSRKRKQSDIQYRISCNLRTRLAQAVRRGFKAGSAVRLLGCSIQEFKIYFERKFTEGMTWDNYGEWHIDHIKPLSKFDLSDKEQIKKACHFSNLQPLWATDNLHKYNR